MLATIVTTRLSIEAVTADDLDTLLAGCTESNRIRIPVVWLDDDPAERETITFIAPRMRNEPGLTPWRFRLIVRREDATMIGHIGFHDVPTAGRLEVGYTVLPAYRRGGYASEATRALMDAAAVGHGIHRFRLAISPTSGPSLAMANRLGFEHTGDQLDEVDGRELLYERSWP